ncbi:MAG: flagellar biosynthetic protein FliQ [Myxococcota bacterium]
MADELLLQLVQESLLLTIQVAAPPVLAAMIVGVLVGLAQAVTQVQDQALSLAFRVAAVFAALLVAGPWTFARVARFAERVLELAAAS